MSAPDRKQNLDGSLGFLELAHEHLKHGDAEGAINACHQAMHLKSNLTSILSLMASALVQVGYIDDAISYLQQVLAAEPHNVQARSILDKANRALDARNREAIVRKRIGDYTVLKYLGSGWEGAVYLTRDAGGKMLVVKVFYPHRVNEINGEGPLRTLRKPASRCRPVLMRLASRFEQLDKEKLDTMYAIKLLRNDEKITGISYAYEYLIKIQKRHLDDPHFSVSLVGAFLRTQALLLRELRCCLVDAYPRQFMITRAGHFRLIDYGVTIIPCDDFRCLEDHLEIVTLVKLLYSLFSPTKKFLSYDTGVESITLYLNCLSEAAKSLKWLNKIIALFEEKSYSDFLDHRFYATLSCEMPRLLNVAALSKVLAFDCLSQAKRLLNN